MVVVEQLYLMESCFSGTGLSEMCGPNLRERDSEAATKKSEPGHYC